MGGKTTVRTLSFFTVDGSRLAAVLRVPESAEKPAPAVVLCQGLSGVKHLVLPEIAQTLASKGIASLAFDYRGRGESVGGNPELVDPRARVDDALHAVAALIASPEIDSQRVGIYGLSYGGPVAICAATRDRRVKVVVCCSGPGNGETMMRDMRTPDQWLELQRHIEGDRERVAQKGESELVGISELFPFSKSFMAKYKKLSGDGTSSMENAPESPPPQFRLLSAEAMLDFFPDQAAMRLDGRPTLFINGEIDDCATLDQVHAVYNSATEPKKLIVMPGRDHVDLDTGAGLRDQSMLATDWFLKHL